MALATDSSPGEIQLTGDLAGDGTTQSGSNPQLTTMSGVVPGQYLNAKITVDAKGRVTAIDSPSAAELGALLPAATTSSLGVVQIGSNLSITTGDTAGYQEIDFGGALAGSPVPGTGLANSSCSSYTFSVTVDGGNSQTITETGDNLQTFAQVISVIHAQTNGITASITNGNLRLTSDTTGRNSSIAVQGSTYMFACMSNFVALSSAVAGTGTCEVYVADASDTTKGVVQIGDGINVASGVISVDLSPATLPVATTTTLGAVIVPTSGNIDVDVNGNISVPLATTSAPGVMEVGSGLAVTSGVVSVDVPSLTLPDATTSSKGVVQVGSGLDVASGVLSVNYTDVLANLPDATTSSKGVMEVGSGLAVTSGVVSVDEAAITLADATTSSKGIVQIGSNIDVASGVISVADATTSSLGVVQVGSGLDVASGVLSLGIASDTVLGGIKVGSGLSIDGTGVLSATAVPNATTSSKGVVQIGSNIDVASGVISVADATTSSLGVVQVGSGLDVASGVLSLSIASGATLGGVKVGTGLSIDGAGVLSASPADATTSSKGVVQIGSNIDVASGVISVANATNTTKGLVTTADSNNITISSGSIDVGTNIPQKNAANVYSKAQVVALDSLTSASSVAIDASLGNTFDITMDTDVTLENPTNLTAGQTFTFVISQDATGGHALSFGTNYKFRIGITPTASTTPSYTDIMSCVSDGTYMYCSYNKGFV